MKYSVSTSRKGVQGVAGILYDVLFVTTPLAMLLLAIEATLTRVVPHMLEFADSSDFYQWQYYLWLLFVALVIHVVRHVRPGVLAITMGMANLGLIQIWLIIAAPAAEALSYRLTPLYLCGCVGFVSLLLSAGRPGVVYDLVALIVSMCAVELALYLTRLDMLMIVWYAPSIGDRVIVYMTYGAVAAYCVWLIRYRRCAARWRRALKAVSRTAVPR